MTDNPYTGSSFDDFLQEEDLYEECTAIAIKRVLARQLESEMKRQNLIVGWVERSETQRQHEFCWVTLSLTQPTKLKCWLMKRLKKSMNYKKLFNSPI